MSEAVEYAILVDWQAREAFEMGLLNAGLRLRRIQNELRRWRATTAAPREDPFLHRRVATRRPR